VADALPVLTWEAQVRGELGQRAGQAGDRGRVDALVAGGERLCSAGGLVDGDLPGGLVDVVEQLPVGGLDLVLLLVATRYLVGNQTVVVLHLSDTKRSERHGSEMSACDESGRRRSHELTAAAGAVSALVKADHVRAGLRFQRWSSDSR
jgi:hypothetical protein